MTALLPDRDLADERRSAADVRRDLRHRRPLVLSSVGAGLVAAGGPLLVLMGIGVAGWFLTDAGVHGAPRDGLRVGAIAWLMAHGSGVRVDGAAVTVLPLGLTLLAAWSAWRAGHRLGRAVSGHGPDADRIADGERDWTVLLASGFFASGYIGLVVLTHQLASTAQSAPSLRRALGLAVLICAVAAAPAIAGGSGRAAVWGSWLPVSVVSSVAAARSVLGTFGWACAVTFLVALALDVDTALNLVSQLGTDAAGTVLLLLVCLAVLPNATAWTGAYLLGPGFSVGVLTIVSPAQVTVGALPLFPLLAALPDPGPTPGWVVVLIAVPALVAALGAIRAQRVRPTLRYDEGALHGCAGGMLAGVAFWLVAALSGGSAGPGRMSEVGPLVGSVLVHALTAFGLGGLVGGLLITWWQRRGMVEAAEADA